MLDKTCLKNIYYGHIHSHILYRISVWGSMIPQCKINEISKIHFHQGQDITDQFKDLNIIPFKGMIRIAMCKVGHNISHKYIPAPIIQLFDKFGGRKSHHYPTHNKHIPNIQHHQDEQYNRSFLCRSILEFNRLPMELKRLEKTTSFLRQLKRQIFK